MFPARSPRAIARLALVGAGLGVLCARYDLEFSRCVVEQGASWAAFGQRFGELPGVLVFALAAAALYIRPEVGARHWFARQLPWLLCSIGFSAAAALITYRVFGVRLPPLEAMLALLVALAATRLARRQLGVGRALGVRLEAACLCTVRLGISSWLLVSALKLGWGRVRFRDLAPLAQDFTPWYVPQGWTGHSSFPSGHAAMGWMLLPSLLLWPPRTRGYRWAFALSLGWGSFVAASRVVIGAHYLSDVLFSSAFAYAVVAYALDRLGQPSPQRPLAERTASPDPDPGR